MERSQEHRREALKTDSELYETVDSTIRAEELRKKREDFDEKVIRLANKVVDYEQKGPQFEYLTEMMRTFLDVTVQLQGTMEALSAVNDAMECLNDAILFIDSSLAFDRDLISSSLETKYGFFARMRQRRQIKRAIRNNTNRMMAMVESINGKFGMAMAITDALKIACYKMKSMMDRSRRKSEKRRAKIKTSGGSVPLTGEASAADLVLARVRSERGIGDVPPAPSSDKTDGGDGSSATAGGIDDIL